MTVIFGKTNIIEYEAGILAIVTRRYLPLFIALLTFVSVKPGLADWKGSLSFSVDQTEGIDHLELEKIQRLLIRKSRESLEKLDRALPSSIKQDIEKHSLKVRFTNTNSFHGLFIGNENEAEMIISIQAFLKNDGQTLFFHEFFHFVQHLYRPQEDSWLKEGLARQFEYFLTGKTHWASIREFSQTNARPLVIEYDPFRPNAADYGQSFLFTHYLVSQCGGEELFWKIVKSGSSQVGASFIHQILLEESDCYGFFEVHRDFLIAKSHNQLSISENSLSSKYQVLSTTFPLAPLHSSLGPDLEVTIASMPKGTSIKVTLDAFLQLDRFPEDREIIFLENIFPYRVMTEFSDNMSSFHLLILNNY